MFYRQGCAMTRLLNYGLAIAVIAFVTLVARYVYVHADEIAARG